MNPRVSVKLDGSVEFVMVVRWQHVGCPEKKEGFMSTVFSALNPKVYAQFSPSVQSAYGYVARSKGVVVDTAFVRAIDHLVVSGTSARCISKLHKKLVHHAIVDVEILQMDLYQAALSAPSAPASGFFTAVPAHPLPLPPPVPEKPDGVSMRMKGSVFAHIVSSVRVMDLYRASADRRQDWSVAFNVLLCAWTLALDHTFRITKHVYHWLNGKRTRMFTAVLIISNHAGQVVGLFYTTTKSLEGTYVSCFYTYTRCTYTFLCTSTHAYSYTCTY
jgi:hypothetical protein